MKVEIRNLCKSFGDKQVLQNVNLDFEDHEIYCLMAPSGMGKTTLLRIMMGLETYDSGTITGIQKGSVGVMFQEDRLLDYLTPVENISLVCPKTTLRSTLEQSLAEILPEDSLKQPVSELSGGMKRRVALARTMWYPSSLLLMDEPFTGLDEETKKTVINYLLGLRKGRTLIVSTHDPDDVGLLGAQVIRLDRESSPDTEEPVYS